MLRSLLRIVVPVVLVAGGFFLWYDRRDTPQPATDAPVAAQTVAVVRADLAVTESLTGTLGYGRAQPLKGGKEGVVTWLPKTGVTIERGDQLYRADDKPVPLFYGSMPLYRDLGDPGTVGRDVRIVARNLRALGYSIKDEQSRTPVREGEAVLTSSMIAAIKRWQRHAELPETGRIGAGDVVVLPGAVRVDGVTAQRGDSAATPLITVTSTTKVITAAADVTQAGTIRKGQRVTVVLPGEKTVRGKVSAIGAEVQEEEGTETPKRVVTVTVDDAKGLGGIEAAKVQVDLPGETRKDVLAIPVGALAALSEGGYAVQTADGRLVGVETGMFAKGLVEVTGDGITEGLRVVTTS